MDIAKFISFRFSWVPPISFLLACVGFFVGGINHDLGVFIVSIGIAAFVIGNILIVFFPKREHKTFFGKGSKLLVAGFTLVFGSFFLDTFIHYYVFSELIYYLGLVFFILGIVFMNKKV